MSGPLVLGSGGRVGRLLRTLAAQGLWPGPEPVWHTRGGEAGTLGWDLRAGPPAGLDLGGAWGVVVLAGATTGNEEALAANAEAARAGLGLARRWGLGPVLLFSSAAVYGRAAGPNAEDGPARPATPYGASKLAMEQAVGAAPEACRLRVGNVAGADALFGAMAAGPVTLDQLADGTSPRRACLGPATLARALVALLAQPRLPPVLNLAQPGLVAMADLLDAAGAPFSWRPARPEALPALSVDLSRLLPLAPLPPATPTSLVEEARLGGWRPRAEAA